MRRLPGRGWSCPVPHVGCDKRGFSVRVRGVQVTVPAHRMTPLKNAWLSLYQPVTENLKLDMRMNLKTRKARPALSAFQRWQLSQFIRQH